MAKNSGSGNNVTTHDEHVKSRKKQAKKEARLMLKLEQAKKDVQKSEQKVAKAQSNLQENHSRLQELEVMLSQLQTKGKISPQRASQQAHQETAPQSSEIFDSGNSFEDSPAIEELHRASPEPAEGRPDITETPQTSPETSVKEDAQALAGTFPSASTPEMATPLDQQKNPSATTGEATTPIEHIPVPDAEASSNGEVHTEILIAPTEEEQALTIESGEGNIPVIEHNPHAWPPEPIREELAEAIEQEMTQEQKEKQPEGETSTSNTSAAKPVAGSGEHADGKRSTQAGKQKQSKPSSAHHRTTHRSTTSGSQRSTNKTDTDTNS